LGPIAVVPNDDAKGEDDEMGVFPYVIVGIEEGEAGLVPDKNPLPLNAFSAGGVERNACW
jgi:hypothetical protein